MNPRSDSNLPGATAIVLVMTAVLLVPWLGETLFNSKGEPREAIVAVSILQQGNWILPTNFGTDIPFKPPFMAWIIASLAWLFNGGVVNEFLSRLPSALAATALVAGGYFWARRARGTRFAMIFSLVTLTSVEVFRAALACRLDMVLTACMVGALYMLYDLGERQGRLRALRYAAVILLLTCATLTKGPIGALLPCLAVGIYRLFRRRRFVPTLFQMLGIALCAMVVPALWYWAAYNQGGEHFLDLMLEENIGRLTGKMSYESHSNPVWYNFLTLATGLLPWTAMLLLCLFYVRRWRKPSLQPAALFALVVAVTVVGFYCIPESKRSVYLLPAYPFLCYGIASVLDSVEASRPVRIFTWFMAVIAVAAPVALVCFQIWPVSFLPMHSIPWWRYFAVALPVVVGVAWMVNRHSPVGHLLVIVWSLYLTYSVAAMPAVLNAKSDIVAVPCLEKAPAVLSYGTHFRPYTINFYMTNSIRHIDSFDATAAYPPGTAVIIGAVDADRIPDGFEVDTLRVRSCDTRRTLLIATKK